MFRCHAVRPQTAAGAAGGWQSTHDRTKPLAVRSSVHSVDWFGAFLCQVVNKLLGERIDIVVAGDSMMRQLYTRLVQMLRGRRRVFDYRVRQQTRLACDPWRLPL